jgi:glycosyltransferase involved in cell wall biosynthesis
MAVNLSGHILFDAERMKYPHTGLYHFCLQLGNAIKDMVAGKDKLHYYIPASAKGFFGSEVQYLIQHSFHKFFQPSMDNIQVWHATHQSTDYFPFRRKSPVVLTVHDLNFMLDEEKSDQKKMKYIADLQKKVDASSHIVTISHFVKSELQKYISVKEKPVTVIYNGCNVYQPSLEDALHQYMDIQDDFLFTIGTITSKKNFHVLPGLLHNNRMKLVIAGITKQNSYRNNIIDEAIKWGVRDRVIFTGAISESEKAWYYQHCKAFIFPSIAEGFGLPVIEAMYYGKPVFLSNQTSLPEIGGSNAFYFNEFEASYMQEVLKEGLERFTKEQSDLLKKQSAKFDWKESARQYISIYNSLC